MIKYIPPNTVYMPGHDGWYVSTLEEEVKRWEASGVCDSGTKPKLITANFMVNGVMQVATRTYPIWLWRPGEENNEFGPVSP